MAKADTSVKYLWWTMQGAGATGSGAGGMVAYLDKVLVNGFNLVTLTSLSVTGNVATATRSGGHGFVRHAVITIAGATPESLNGEWRIDSVPNSTTFTFLTEGIADGAATGTITAKYSPLGWVKEFSGTNDATYRSPNPLSPRSFFRFIDTNSDSGYVETRGNVTQTAYNDTSGQWGAGNDVQRPHLAWTIIGDDRTFYGFHYRTYDRLQAVACGDFVSFVPNDTKNDMLMEGATNACGGLWDSGATNYTHPQVRSASSGVGAVPIIGAHIGCTRSGDEVAAHDLPDFPSPVDQGMLLADHLVRETGHAGNPIRGKLRGSYWVLAQRPFASLTTSVNTALPGVVIEGVSGLEGRRLAILGLQKNGTAGSTDTFVCRACIDVTGPWE